MKARIVLLALPLLLISVGFAVNAQKNRSCSEKDMKAYFERIQQLKGKVTILNHPTLGKTPGTGLDLVFQREGCSDCLIGVHTNGEGTYEVSLGVGRYKVMSMDPRCDYAGGGCDCYSMLDAKQPEYVDVKRDRQSSEFDINLTLEK